LQASLTRSERSKLEQLRLENETLSGIVALVASSTDLRHVLDRVVDLLTKASDCHACFLYVLNEFGDRLRLRAASPVYSHLVGRTELSMDEGLGGWAVRNSRPALVDVRTLGDPRIDMVEGLDGDRITSAVAVPIPSRGGPPLGVMLLYAAVPHEFEGSILNVLTHAGALVAGAIENAQLYEDAQHHVDVLTELADLSENIAVAATLAQLHDVATSGVKELLGCTECLLFEAGEGDRLRLVATAPAGNHREIAMTSGVEALLTGPEDDAPSRQADVAAALGVEAGAGAIVASPVRTGAERLGLLVAVLPGQADSVAAELLRSVAHQVALATRKTDLIARLAADNLGRDLFKALEAEDTATAASLAHVARINVDGASVVLEIRPEADGTPERWPKTQQAIETALRRSVPGTLCDPGPVRLRALVPLTIDAPEEVRRLLARLLPTAESAGVIVGASCAGRGLPHLHRALEEAADAGKLARAFETYGRALFYGDMGAYRYLVGLVDGGGPRDHLREAVDRLVAYDEHRGSALLETLETYLENGCSTTSTSRRLIIHVNTLRQRLQRIEEVTGLAVADEDLLALHLAIKLARLHSATTVAAPRSRGRH
jgi:GAF domain-containing protein